jgi:thiol-disulfide isomerase/thioredoxin
LETLEKFSNAVIVYLKQFSASSNRERLFSALVSGYLQTGNYQDILAILNQFEDTPPSAYAQIAYSLVNDEVFEKVDINIRIKKAIELMNTSIYEVKSDNYKYKPSYITITEWDKRNKIRVAGLLEQYGQILMSVEQYEDALSKYNEALDFYKKDAPNALYENVMELCGILKKPDTAYEIGLLAIHNNYPSQNIIEDMRVLHSELAKTEAFEPWMIKILNDTKIQRLKKLSFENFSDSINNIYFLDLSGKKINLKELTGKVVVITFWSSWCDPCDEALVGLDSLTKLYKSESNIYFASVNLWETDEDIDKTVKEFFSEYKPQFNILLDKMSQSAYELGIGGLPFVCFIGKDGKLEFVDKGYVNLEEFINSSSDKIDFLTK